MNNAGSVTNFGALAFGGISYSAVSVRDIQGIGSLTFGGIGYDTRSIRDVYGIGTLSFKGISTNNQHTTLVMRGITVLNGTYSGGNRYKADLFELPQSGLNSVIQLGPFRFAEQIQADETSLISTLIVGLSASADTILIEDYNFGNSIEDYNLGDSIEDYGANAVMSNNFDLILRDTDDGVNPILTGDENLEIMNNLGSSQIYAPNGFSSIWHNFIIKANEPKQFYAIKFLDVTGQLTGRVIQG